ncbi:ead/Ea22-like family protein [Klebsiella pneumoniae]|uniref:ead/Ea22-like family protein n=1 Tax=Klebsiella pneumoniae TaxID=573 RepID=UPI000E2D4018|nr:ead/Ea22-like family protein [Klebsiella pneumoniae]SXN18207.1 Ead domain protein [Klebsiella pneumoniae]
MTTDITELAQSLKNAASKALIEEGLTWFSEEQLSHEDGIALHKADAEFIALANPANVLALVEALEKAQTINAAAEKLVRCKGRYHSEQNYRALAALFGVNTPDLPPLDDESHAVTVENLQESAYRAGLTAGWNLGLANNNDGFNKCLAAHVAGIKVETE